MVAVVIGVLTFLGICLVPVVVVSALVHVRELGGLCTRLGRRMYLLPTPPPLPPAPPLEKLAADLRRLRRDIRSPRPGLEEAQIRGTLAAYDGVLTLTARALDVETTLGDLPEGLDQEVERLRLEHALGLAGLSWQVQEH